MKQKNKSLPIPISRYAKLCLHYGIFAVLSQCVMILLCVLCEDESVATELLRYRYLPYLEYPLMSLALLVGGSLLIDWATLTQ